MSRARDTADQINRVNSSAADATAITVDSSENMLVGKTATDLDVAGSALFNTGQAYHTRSGGTALYLNRLSSDGTIADFRKDGTTVGSIGNSTTNLLINSTSGSGLFFGSSTLAPMLSGSLTDNSLDIGTSSYRYKDAYLSGGVYLGGTGSANKLEDVETGTFSPSLSGTGGGNPYTMSNQDGHYSKIGNSVTVYFRVSWSSKNGSGGYTLITGLPFASKPNTGAYYYMGSTDQSQTTTVIGVTGNATQAIFFNSSGALVANSSVANSGNLIATVTYISAT